MICKCMHCGVEYDNNWEYKTSICNKCHKEKYIGEE